MSCSIEDTSEINFERKAGRKRNLGRVGNGKDIGLFVHPALAADADDGSLLGLAGAKIWRRTRVKEDDYKSLPIEEKESYKWLEAPIATRTPSARLRGHHRGRSRGQYL